MKKSCICLIAGLMLLGTAGAQTIPVTFNKIDTTMKIGKAGYKVTCRNKYRTETNELSIRPIGFQSDAKPMDFPIRGRVAAAQVDDLNSDGWPDLILFIYTDSNAVFGTVYTFISDADKNITPVILPDAMMDGKVNTGYKGHDTFSLMEGYLLQKFPIYKQGDDKDKPTGGTRVLLYQIAKNPENGGWKWSMTRNYETH